MLSVNTVYVVLVISNKFSYLDNFSKGFVMKDIFIFYFKVCGICFIFIYLCAVLFWFFSPMVLGISSMHMNRESTKQ